MIVRLDAAFNSADGVLTVQWVSGGNVLAMNGSVATIPAAPSGLAILRSTGLQMIPQSTPNGVNLVIHYSDSDVAKQAVKDGALRAFYYTSALGRWVELPVSEDKTGHTVTVSNVDVSAFEAGLTSLALMG